MKRTRSAELLWRLTKWRELYLDLARQPWITLEREVDIETAKALFGLARLSTCMISRVTIYAPMEVEVEP